MFSVESNGYSKEEVDKYISKLKSELMEKKLSLLDSEQRILDLKQQKIDIEAKEKNIMMALSTIEHAQKIQEEGSKNLYNLSTKQNALIVEKIDGFIEMLWVRHPELKNDIEFYKEAQDLEETLSDSKKNVAKASINSDPMRELLNRMQQYRSQSGEARTIRIERSNIKPVFDEKEDIDGFMSSKPSSDKLYNNVELDANGFDLKEAVNPKIDLDEIMKAFDFFNNEGDKWEKNPLFFKTSPQRGLVFRKKGKKR